jgi:hypothetical protein
MKKGRQVTRLGREVAATVVMGMGTASQLVLLDVMGMGTASRLWSNNVHHLGAK